MNAPLPNTPPEGALLVARAPLTHFGPSLTNRKHRPEHIKNLGASIAHQDIIQPITARPWLASQIVPAEHALEALLHDAAERRDLMPADDTPWQILDGIEPLPRKIMAMQPTRAQAVFLKRYVELTTHLRRAA